MIQELLVSLCHRGISKHNWTLELQILFYNFYQILTEWTHSTQILSPLSLVFCVLLNRQHWGVNKSVLPKVNWAHTSGGPERGRDGVGSLTPFLVSENNMGNNTEVNMLLIRTYPNTDNVYSTVKHWLVVWWHRFNQGDCVISNLHLYKLESGLTSNLYNS